MAEREQLPVQKARTEQELSGHSHLANKHYPEKLDELSPGFISHIPEDMLCGEPFQYLSEGESGYTLYSVGWNERDDGGSPGRKLFDEKEGDWVWQIH